mmetsp:Transcript_44119/g.139209  ORF Transcript_44119/g.139209 Transcript_44119/m.139209 type:complete len:615 (-) Transcript_44119:20-1864(-)
MRSTLNCLVVVKIGSRWQRAALVWRESIVDSSAATCRSQIRRVRFTRRKRTSTAADVDLHSLSLKEEGLDEKIEQAEECVSVYRDMSADEKLSVSLDVLGRLYRQAGNLEGAMKCLEESLTLSEKAQKSIHKVGDSLRVSFFEQQQATYNQLVDLLASLAREDVDMQRRALLVAERSKARTLTDTIVLKQQETSTSLSTWNELSWDELVDVVKGEKKTMIEFYVTSQHLLTWMLQPDGQLHFVRTDLQQFFTSHNFPSSSSNPSQQLQTFVENLIRDIELEARRASEDAISLLFQLCLQPIQHLLRKQVAVMIVPHSALYLLPWYCLLSCLDAPPLLLPSLSLLMAIRSRGQAKRAGGALQAMVVGNPLPVPWVIGGGAQELEGAEREAEAVARSLASMAMEPELLLREEASKEAVLRRMEDSSWLHFACHTAADVRMGLISREAALFRPHTSAIFLANVERRTGLPWSSVILSLEEVCASEVVKGSVVVMSSCSSGRGAVKQEGVIGLARAFLMAGASTVVCSLWDLRDGSQRTLMELFYRRLEEGEAVEDALFHAQRSLQAANPCSLSSSSTDRGRLDRPPAAGPPALTSRDWGSMVVVGASCPSPKSWSRS